MNFYQKISLNTATVCVPSSHTEENTFPYEIVEHHNHSHYCMTHTKTKENKF